MTSLTRAAPSEQGRSVPTQAEAAQPLVMPIPAAASVGSRWTTRRVAFWISHFAYWALAFAVNILLCDVFGVDQSPAFTFAEILLCFVATATMRTAAHRQALLDWVGLSNIGVIVGGGLTSAVLVQFVLLAIDQPLGVEPPTRPEAVARLAVTLVMITNWCGFYFGYQLFRERNSTEVRALQAESQALRHELRHLQSQISPHFLFNALNTVQACRNDPEAIATLTQALAAYLRFLLQPAAVLEPLSRELDALEEYFTIQEVRFGDGLETQIDCDFAARGLLVPPLLVQPLVENAIKYGGQTAPLPIRVHVGVRLDGDWLEVEVANTGCWVAPGGAASTGTGLPSLERRLQLLMGPTCSVSHREEDGWVRVLIRIPVPPTAARVSPEHAA